MKRYLTILYQMMLFSFKSSLEYRWNFLVQMFYGPAYVFIMYLLVEIAFAKTQILAGWTKQEGILLFSVFQFLYALCYVIFMKGVRHVMWTAVRHGELDFMLTKPINIQFYATFSKPNFELLLLAVGTGLIFFRQLWILSSSIEQINALAFVIMFILGMIIAYFAVAIYATASFYIIRAEQVLELYDKMTDFAQYPLPLFPGSIQMIFFSVVPIAFFSYLPTLILLGKGSLSWIVASVLFAVCLFFINQFAWKKALQHYSSASS